MVFEKGLDYWGCVLKEILVPWSLSGFAVGVLWGEMFLLAADPDTTKQRNQRPETGRG